MSGSFTAFLIVAAGTGINSVRQVQKGSAPFGTLLGGIVFGLMCVAIDDATNSRVGTAFAMLFLLGSVLTNGVRFMDTLTKVVENY